MELRYGLKKIRNAFLMCYTLNKMSRKAKTSSLELDIKPLRIFVV